MDLSPFSPPSSQTVTVPYATDDATNIGDLGKPGIDYTSASGTLTFPAHSSEPQFVPIPILSPDELDDGYFTVTLSEPQNAELANSWMGVTIHHFPTLSVTSLDVEQGDAAAVHVTLSRYTQYPIVAAYEVQDGTADSPDDYDNQPTITASASTTPGEITFAPGNKEMWFSFLTHVDTTNVDDEKFYLKFSDISAVTQPDPNEDPVIVAAPEGQSEAQGFVNILLPPTLTVSAPVAFEGQPEPFVVTLSRKCLREEVVRVSTREETATDSVDYQPLINTLVIPKGETTAYAPVATCIDDLADSLETFHLDAWFLDASGTTPTGAPDATGTATIRDPEPIQPSSVVNLTIYYGDGTAIPEDKEETPGGLIWCSQSELTTMQVHVAPLGGSGGKVVLDYDNSHILVYHDEGRSELIDPGTESLATGDYPLYVTGFSTSDSIGDSWITLTYLPANGGSSASDTVKYTVADAWLEAIDFTSNYREGGRNGVRIAKKLGEKGEDAHEHDWALTSRDTNVICQPMGSVLTLNTSVVVKPAGILFCIDGTSGYPSGDFTPLDKTPTSTGSPQQVPETAAQALPGWIDWYSTPIHWSLQLVESQFGPAAPRSLETTSFDIAATYAMPIDTSELQAQNNWITNKRLSVSISAAQDLSCVADQYAAARNIQLFLSTGAAWGTPGNIRLHRQDPDYYWRQIPEDEKELAEKGLCDQHAMLHELMLGQLGIQAKVERILATKEDITITNTMNFMSFDANESENYAHKKDWNYNELTLFFDFHEDDEPIQKWEGSVRVGGKVYPEGGRSQSCALVVGEDGPICKAEWDAIAKIAIRAWGYGNTDRMQRWAWEVLSDYVWANKDGNPLNEKLYAPSSP